MTVDRKYPTAIGTNPGVWTTLINACNAANNQCASKLSSIAGSYLGYLKTYGFAIPADAVISRITLGIKGSLYTVGSPLDCLLSFRVKKGSETYECGRDYDANTACSVTGWNTQNIAAGFLTVDDLNTENFTTWILLGLGTAEQTMGVVDCVYIEVEYEVPAVGVASKRLLVGVGL